MECLIKWVRVVHKDKPRPVFSIKLSCALPWRTGREGFLYTAWNSVINKSYCKEEELLEETTSRSSFCHCSVFWNRQSAFYLIKRFGWSQTSNYVISVEICFPFLSALFLNVFKSQTLFSKHSPTRLGSLVKSLHKYRKWWVFSVWRRVRLARLPSLFTKRICSDILLACWVCRSIRPTSLPSGSSLVAKVFSLATWRYTFCRAEGVNFA